MPDKFDNNPQAGNEADDKDKAQENFDNIANRLHEVEANGNQIIQEYENGNSKNGTHVDSHGDTVQDNPNADPADVNDQEKNPDQIPKPLGDEPRQRGGLLGKMGRGFKKGGAASVIALLVGTGAISSSVLLGPAALVAVMEKVLTNHSSNDTRATIMMRRAYIGGLLNGKDCSGGGIKCRFTTMSEEQKAKWESHKFKVEGSATPNGRFKATAITFPDGTRVTTGTDFDNHAKYNLEARKAANLVMNPRASTFTDAKSKFRTKIVSKWKASIDRKMVGSTDEDPEKRNQAIDNDMNNRTGAVVDEDGNSRMAKLKAALKSNSRISAALEKHGGKLKKITNPADIASFACTSYSLVKTAIAGVKLYYYQELIRFAMPWMQVAAQIYTYGDVDPELMDNLMSRLTWYSTKKDDPSYNKSAFDSNGLRSALYGDFDALTESAKHYTTWYMTGAVMGSNIVKTIEGFVGGKENLQNVCATARGASFLGTVFCLSGVAQAAGCAAAVGGLLLFGNKITEYVNGELIDDAIKLIADANLTSSLKGVPLGDAISSGVGLMLLQKNMGAGMRFATSSAAVGSFISETDDEYYRYVDEIALDDARKNPFDFNNSYSLVSQMALAVNQYKPQSGAFFDNIANIFAITSNPLTSLFNPKASALYSQPSELTRRVQTLDRSLERCGDEELKDSGFVCEWQGKPISIVRDAVLKKAERQADGDTSMIDGTIDYMLGKNPEKEKYINEDGSTVGSDEDTEYTMYRKYCTEDREFPLGTSDYDYGELSSTGTSKLAWSLGARCGGMNADGTVADENVQVMIDNFFIYYHMCETQVAIADGADCYSTQSLAATSTGGSWQVPVAGTCGDGFDPTGSRIGRNHKGVDISAASGTPILAPADLKIVFVGQSPDGSTGNQVTAIATDGSEYSFRFMHMLEKPTLGQTVKKGTPVGKVGSTGDSSGPHLHMDVFPPGVDPMSYGGQVDPVTTFAQHGVNISGCR